MFDWFRGLDRDGRRTFWACAAGYGLDGMDVQIYSFVVPVLIAAWGITKPEAGQLGSVALLMSAIAAEVSSMEAA